MRNQPHDDFRGLGLSAAALAGDDDAGVFAGALHLFVRSLGNGEDVGGALVDFATLNNECN
jgi:hypothetical protein